MRAQVQGPLSQIISLLKGRVTWRDGFGYASLWILGLVQATALIGPILPGCGGDDRFSVDQDGDGWPAELDCDDENKKIFPSADDAPGDGIDQDCSGRDANGEEMGGAPFVGSGGTSTGGVHEPGVGGRMGTTGGMGGAGSAADDDGDGVSPPGDCDDSDAQVHPGAFDVAWDDIDQDCSGADSRDRDGDGLDGGPGGVDCDDTRSEVFPGAIEIVLNRVDENCDGSDLVNIPQFADVLAEDAVVAEPPDLALVQGASGPELLLVWIDARRGDARDVLAQRLSLEGERLGDELEISVSEPSLKTEVRIAARPGGFVVTWMTESGGWARQLAADATPVSIPLGITEEGAKGLRAASGGVTASSQGSWGFIWQSVGELSEATVFRTMTLDEVRSDIMALSGPSEFTHSSALLGTSEGYLPIWEGEIEGTRGVIAERRDPVGNLLEEAWLLHEGSVGEPTIASREDGYALVFRQPGSPGYVAGLFLDADFVTAEDPFRLSLDSSQQVGFHLMTNAERNIVVWNDGRHLLDFQAVESVYAQSFAPASSAAAMRQWSPDRAIFAGTGGELGGAVVVEDALVTAIWLENQVSLFVEPLSSAR